MSLNPSLKKAAACLNIRDVVLKDIRAGWGIARELTKPIQDPLVEVIHPHCVSHSTLVSEGAETTRHIFEIRCGVRLLENDANEANRDASVLASIVCLFLADFDEVLEDDSLNEDALTEFGQHNVPFNVWPYWREVVQSAASRMGLPRIVLPPFRLGRSATQTAIAKDQATE